MPYNNVNSFASTYGEHRKFLEFTIEQHNELKKYANSLDLTYFCTPCDVKSLMELETINCPFYKVASRDITNIPLLIELSKINKPVIISTGMATLKDIDIAIATLNKPDDMLIIMQCTSIYPCPPNNTNLNVIYTLRERYPYHIGFSDHTAGILASSIACMIGVKLIEKHITLDRCMKGSDHVGSLEEYGLKKLVQYINDIPLYLGQYAKEIDPKVLPFKTKLMKSITSNVFIKKNTIIEQDMICYKCPGNGISWNNINLIIGKKALVDIQKDCTISLEQIYE